MDRIIEIKVCGNHLTKDSKNAGTKGESNVTRLRITFDENWEDFAKQVVFWDAHGQNPVRVILTTQMIEDISKSTRVYLVPIPAEAMARAGWLTFVIKGTLDNKNFASIQSTLEVKDSPDILEPIDPTPTEVEQLQAEIEGIKEDIKDVEEAHREIKENAQIAKESADKALSTIGKASYIGENGYWYIWDEEKGEFINTEIKAQGGSIVYMGATPPDYADIWINENSVLYIRNANGEFKPLSVIKGEDGKSAYEQAQDAGYTGSLEQFITLFNNLTYTIESDHLSDTNNPHKVTAQQVGALPISGGEITGSEIRIAGGYGRVRAVENYVQLDVFDTPKDDNNRRKLVLGGKKAIDKKNAVTLETYEEGVKEIYSIYGEHNKPTPSDVGAVPTKGGTITGPLIIDKESSWGQLVFYTPSGYYRAFEADDSRTRIDVRDEQDTTKRRYLDIFTNEADSRMSHAFRFGQTNDGETTAAYVLHSENINNFVISSGSYEGTGDDSNKTIPIRKTTQAIIITATDTDSVQSVKDFAVIMRGVERCWRYVQSSTTPTFIYCTWADDSVSVTSSFNEKYRKYNYTLIG